MTRLLSRKLFLIDFTPVVDSHLGQTAKNLAGIFEELGRIPNPERYLFLIDEIDAIALDRTNSQDVREMGRVTSAFLKALDELNPRVTVIATTNLYRYIDRALSRRFDAVVDFDRYSQEDLLDIADKLMARFLSEFGRPALKKSLFRKILKTGVRLPFPGELAGLIKSSLLFSDPDDPVDYLKRLYSALHGKAPAIESLRAEGFSVRDVELLTGISKSAVSRAVHEGAA
jgi:SpoVK/Ycf46/Vps4 family AAA+-type ATPase